MEGGGVGGSFPYGNYQRNIPLLKPRPSLTPIDRFLYGQNHFSQPEIITNFNDKGTLVPTYVNCQFVSFSDDGAINGHAGEILPWPGTLPSHDTSTNFVEGIFLNEQQNPNWSQQISPNVGLRDGETSARKTPRGRGKRDKACSSAILIKGQWTDEEDR